MEEGARDPESVSGTEALETRVGGGVESGPVLAPTAHRGRGRRPGLREGYRYRPRVTVDRDWDSLSQPGPPRCNPRPRVGLSRPRQAGDRKETRRWDMRRNRTPVNVPR